MSVSQIFLALIIVFGILGVVALENYFKTQRAIRRQPDTPGRDIEAQLARLEQVEKRVAVLERIVTDGRFDLDQQFRDLDKTGKV